MNVVLGAARNHLMHCGADAMHKRGKEREDMIEELLELVGKVAR